MDQQLQLSQQLIDDVQDVLMAKDERARDPAVAMQYLMAIVGYALGSQDIGASDKDDALEQLTAFAGHVMQQVNQQKEQQASPASEDAFGVWKPGDP